MSEQNLFGNIITPGMVERALVATLNMWIRDYIGEIERVDGWQPGSIELPRGIVTTSEFERWPEDQLPVILVVNAGLAEPPRRRNDSENGGVYDVVWRVGVAPIVSALDQPGTRNLASAYVTAVGLALSQHKMLKSPLYPDGLATFSMWVGEDYTDIPWASTRSIQAGQALFNIGVENVRTEQAGPRVPLSDSYTDPGPLDTFDEVDIDVVLEPIT